MKVLLDTNILARTSQLLHPMHLAAVAATQILRRNGDLLVALPQNLYEFWAVSTRPLAVNGLSLSIGEAQAELQKLKTLFAILDDTPAILPVWENLVVKYQVGGKNAHDARLVAGMIGNFSITLGS